MPAHAVELGLTNKDIFHVGGFASISRVSRILVVGSGLLLAACAAGRVVPNVAPAQRNFPAYSDEQDAVGHGRWHLYRVVAMLPRAHDSNSQVRFVISRHGAAILDMEMYGMEQWVALRPGRYQIWAALSGSGHVAQFVEVPDAPNRDIYLDFGNRSVQ